MFHQDTMLSASRQTVKAFRNREESFALLSNFAHHFLTNFFHAMANLRDFGLYSGHGGSFREGRARPASSSTTHELVRDAFASSGQLASTRSWRTTRKSPLATARRCADPTTDTLCLRFFSLLPTADETRAVRSCRGKNRDDDEGCPSLPRIPPSRGAEIDSNDIRASSRKRIPARPLLCIRKFLVNETRKKRP